VRLTMKRILVGLAVLALAGPAMAYVPGQPNPQLPGLMVFWGLIFVGLGFIYMLPTIVGWHRGVRHLFLLFLGNVLFGTSGIGWFVALGYA
jgi:Superinfection immunity protein